MHVVKAGEYPATIARQYGMTTSELLAMNGITDPRKIQVGQQLRVSPKSSSASTAGQKTQGASSATSQTPTVVQPSTGTPGSLPIEIRVVEADPLVESEIEEINPDSMFENVEEIPVVPLDDQ